MSADAYKTYLERDNPTGEARASTERKITALEIMANTDRPTQYEIFNSSGFNDIVKGYSMSIEYSKAAVKAIAAMDRKTKQRIKEAIEGIPGGDIKPLRGSSTLYRLRVGGLRIVFSYPDSNTVLIERIAPRGDVYKGGL